ncbi:DNA cytosine methyltransferase [Niveispirillum sp.]|uniref:DNA cytosine methyltransferase n=1 Tax=Niveispirillum sp. TaxID=1917217 RepID=UPI001B538AB2|nr:DNA cytosine methyltransferase [Niveispirillum sp.]MBP7336915.1 DNA cytosine methyltransferase [Niveispirillum sp.]
MDTLFPTLPIARRPRKARTGIPAGQSLAAPWPLDGAINVVLFAGMGGACQGLEEAGFPVHVAINHDAVAIAAHKALNPRTKHLQADIYEVCPLDATAGRPVNILWASPDCRDHSVAKGGAPRSPRVRSMPWQVCRWVGVLRRAGLGPSTVMLENVREIRGWGPLIAKRDKATGRVMRLDGTVAAKGERVPREQQMLIRDPRHVGRHWQAWLAHMARLGVDWQDRDMTCADYGVPTTRKRLFGVGQLDGLPIIWPTQTHAHRQSEAVAAARLLPHASAASIIDWTLPLPSIFARAKDLAPATQKRIAVGMKRFVLEAAEPFIVGVNNVSTRASRVFSMDDPLTTQCTVNGNALVGPALVPTTHTTSGDRIHAGRQPIPTLTAGVKGGELAVMAAHVTKFRNNSVGHSPAEAIHTITTAHSETHPGAAPPLGIVGATLAPYRVTTSHSTTTGRAPNTHAIETPMETITTSNGEAITAAWMVQHNTGLVGHSPADGTSTLTTAGTQQQVAAACLIHQRGTGTATSADGALRTVTAGGDHGGDHIGIGAAFLTEYYSVGGQHQDVDAALNTLTAADRFSLTHATLTDPPLTPAQITRAKQVADFLRAHGVWSGGDIVTVTIAGSCWIIADIGMRMLKPHEAAAAHELRMPAAITLDGRTQPLTKTQAMRLIGNSVPKRMSLLLARANARHPLDLPRRAAVAAE